MEDSEVSLKTRTYYFNRDYRDQSNNAGRNRGKPKEARNGYREELTQGGTGWLVSGYTQGTVGFGLDAHEMMGLQLDSGGGRTGTGNLPVGGDGHPDSHYGKFATTLISQALASMDSASMACMLGAMAVMGARQPPAASTRACMAGTGETGKPTWVLPTVSRMVRWQGLRCALRKRGTEGIAITLTVTSTKHG